MQTLPPEYLSEIARQIAFLSAFLGGFAATFLATLLVADVPRRSAGFAIGSAAVAASAFIIAVVASVMLTVVLRPDAPPSVVEGASISNARIISTLAFSVGMYALLASVGVCGWLRSRGTGLATSIAAGVGAVVVTWALAGFG